MSNCHGKQLQSFALVISVTEDKVIRWILPVDEGEDGEQILTLPDDLLEAAGWFPGDELEWLVDDDGITLRKHETLRNKTL